MRIGTSARAGAVTTVLALLVATIGGALVASPATAATCTGVTSTWTGQGASHSWADPANWDRGVPTDTGTGVIGPEVASVDGVTGGVCGLSVLGPATAPGPALTGDVTVGTDLSLSGASSWSGTLSATQGLTLATSADLLLGDGAVVTVSGAGILGAGAKVHASGTPATPPALAVPGALSLGGPVTLAGVALRLLPRDGGAGSLDLAGSTLTLTQSAVSSLREGSTLTSSTGNGALVAATGSRVVVTTGATVQQNAALRLTAGAILGEDGGAAILTGTGSFNWTGGALAGNLTVNLRSFLDGGGNRLLPPESTLTNTGQLVVADGTLDLRGTLVNQASVVLRSGVTVRGTDGAPSTLSNPAGATLSVEPTSGGGSAVLDGTHLVNAGTLSVPAGARLVLAGTSAATTSDLRDGGTLSAPSAPAQPSDTQGTLQITRGATVRLSGTTTLDKATLLLDDPAGDGSTAQLAQGSAAARLNAAAAGGGGFTWRSGAILGALTVDNLTTEISSVNELSRRRVFALDDTHPGRLTLGGTASLNPAVVELGPQSSLVVTGTLTLASAPGGIAAVAGVSGQAVVVATGGTLRHVAQSTTSTGSSSSTSPMTLSVPVLNQGTVTLETSLNVPAGYTQDVAPGAPVNADPPVTGVFGAAVLSGSDGASAVAPITLVRGGLGGTGTVEANPLTTGMGFLHPGTAGASGTLTVKGNLVLGAGTNVQIVLRSATDHDKLVVAPLTVGALALAGSVELRGTVSGLSQGYNPPYGAKVTGLITAAVRKGAFTAGDSSGLSNGFGWRPTYPATPTVDLTVVDVSPPAIGIAGNPAFTQLASQRFTYSAVDNKAGVDVFDVRWRQASPSSGFGGWVYPGAWQRTRLTSQTLGGLVAGRTYCFSVRASDKVHNTSDWSQPLCTAKLLDDRQLSASAGWSRPGGRSGYYNGTYSQSKALGSTLRVAGTFTRVAVTANRCRGCGNLLIYSGSTRIGSMVLNSATPGLASWVSPVLTSRRAVLTLKVSSSGHPVTIDGVGLAR